MAIPVIFCLLSILPAKAANRYWIASSGASFNSSTNWSATSGGTGGASVPGSSDIAIFNGANSSNGSCQLNFVISVLGITTTSAYTGHIIQQYDQMSVGSSGISFGGGSFDASDDLINIEGNLAISGGSFRLSSGITELEGSFTHSGGRLFHNDGLLTFTGTSNVSYDVPASDTFHSISMDRSGSGDKLTLASDDSMVILDDLTLGSGKLVGGYIHLYGDISAGLGFDYGTSELIFRGASNQYLGFLTNITCWQGNITMRKSIAKYLILVSPLELHGGSTQTLKLSKGRITTTDLTILIVGDNVNVSGGSDSSFVNGPMKKEGNDAFIFPVGDYKYYAPLGISAPLETYAQFYAYYNHHYPTQCDYSHREDSLQNVSKSEYWDIERLSGVSKVYITLSWASNRSGGLTQTSSMVVAHWEALLNLLFPEWESKGNGGTTGDASMGTVKSGAKTQDYGIYALGSLSNLNPLPVELTSFSGSVEGLRNRMVWTTASELNNSHFDLERSSDGKHFDVIATIIGGGTRNTPASYGAYDDQPLRALDITGCVRWTITANQS